ARARRTHFDTAIKCGAISHLDASAKNISGHDRALCELNEIVAMDVSLDVPFDRYGRCINVGFYASLFAYRQVLLVMCNGAFNGPLDYEILVRREFAFEHKRGSDNGDAACTNHDGVGGGRLRRGLRLFLLGLGLLEHRYLLKSARIRSGTPGAAPIVRVN